MFGRLGRWCYDRRWAVVGVWVTALVVGGIALTGAGGTQTNADFSLPDVESRRGIDILDESFGGQGAGSTGTIVFQADAGVDDAEVRSASGASSSPSSTNHRPRCWVSASRSSS
jgi:putative drug exporter of the RND superfamily